MHRRVPVRPSPETFRQACPLVGRRRNCSSATARTQYQDGLDYYVGDEAKDICATKRNMPKSMKREYENSQRPDIEWRHNRTRRKAKSPRTKQWIWRSQWLRKNNNKHVVTQGHANKRTTMIHRARMDDRLETSLVCVAACSITWSSETTDTTLRKQRESTDSHKKEQ